MTDQPCDDDCQIFAVLGHELLGWGKVAPTTSQFAVFYRPEGDSYVEQCPWSQMGVTPLPPGKPDPDNMQYFTQPKYEDGGTTALVSYIRRLIARDARGNPQPPYIDMLYLTLRKVDGCWTVTSRAEGPRT